MKLNAEQVTRILAAVLVNKFIEIELMDTETFSRICHGHSGLVRSVGEYSGINLDVKDHAVQFQEGHSFSVFLGDDYVSVTNHTRKTQLVLYIKEVK